MTIVNHIIHHFWQANIYSLFSIWFRSVMTDLSADRQIMIENLYFSFFWLQLVQVLMAQDICQASLMQTFWSFSSSLISRIAISLQKRKSWPFPYSSHPLQLFVISAKIKCHLAGLSFQTPVYNCISWISTTSHHLQCWEVSFIEAPHKPTSTSQGISVIDDDDMFEYFSYFRRTYSSWLHQ